MPRLNSVFMTSAIFFFFIFLSVAAERENHEPDISAVHFRAGDNATTPCAKSHPIARQLISTNYYRSLLLINGKKRKRSWRRKIILIALTGDGSVSLQPNICKPKLPLCICAMSNALHGTSSEYPSSATDPPCRRAPIPICPRWHYLRIGGFSNRNNRFFA